LNSEAWRVPASKAGDGTAWGGRQAGQPCGTAPDSSGAYDRGKCSSTSRRPLWGARQWIRDLEALGCFGALTGVTVRTPANGLSARAPCVRSEGVCRLFLPGNQGGARKIAPSRRLLARRDRNFRTVRVDAEQSATCSGQDCSGGIRDWLPGSRSEALCLISRIRRGNLTQSKSRLVGISTRTVESCGSAAGPAADGSCAILRGTSLSTWGTGDMTPSIARQGHARDERPVRWRANRTRVRHNDPGASQISSHVPAPRRAGRSTCLSTWPACTRPLEVWCAYRSGSCSCTPPRVAFTERFERWRLGRAPHYQRDARSGAAQLLSIEGAFALVNSATYCSLRAQCETQGKGAMFNRVRHGARFLARHRDSTAVLYQQCAAAPRLVSHGSVLAITGPEQAATIRALLWSRSQARGGHVFAQDGTGRFLRR